MAAKGQREDVNWDLDWDDLTGGSAAASGAPATPSPDAGASLTAPVPALGTPPPLPSRAFPSPSPLFTDVEPAPIMPVQRLSANVPPEPIRPVEVVPPTPTASAARTASANSPTRSFTRGQRVKLAEIFPGNPPPGFDAVFTLQPAPGQTLDLCCFGLDESGKLSDDRYFIFYNQKASPEGALNIRGAHGEVFGVDLGKLSSPVKRLVFTATIDGVGSVRSLGPSQFELRATGGQPVARYAFSGPELDDVKALMVAEIYYKDGWRLAAVGQGFAGGLSELLKHFGGQEV